MKIFCVGRNYSEHAKELGNEVPSEPVIFMKPKSALYNSHIPFLYPSFSNELHYEAELVLYICKNGKNITLEQASAYYNQISLGIDFTARDIQTELKKKGLPWEKAKSWDNSAVIGKWKPYNPKKEEAPIHFTMYKNQQLVQTGNSKEMIFSFEAIIANISQYFTLNIGDVVFLQALPPV